MAKNLGKGSQEPARKTRPLRRVRNQVVARVKEAEQRAQESEQRRVQFGLVLWRTVVQVVRQWQWDRCPQQAAGLSFQTVLSIVPALAVVLAAFRATGAMAAESALVTFLSTEFIPLPQEEISGKLLAWSENISFQSLGLVGLVITIFIAFLTFNALEQIVNQIWRVEKRRSLTKRLATFYVTATFGPLLFGLSLYQAAQFGFTEGWIGVVTSVLLTFCGLVLTNYVLPATRVRLSAAAVGALTTTVAVEIAKFAFTSYVGTFGMAKYTDIYGTVAVVPLFLIWIYWSWLMLLLGVEVTHTVQNLHLFDRLEGRRGRGVGNLSNELSTRVNGNTAVRMMAEIAASQERSGEGLSWFCLGEEFRLGEAAIRILTTRLHDHKLLQEPTNDDNWTICGDPSEISVLQVFEAFRSEQEFAEPDNFGISPAENVLSDLLRASQSQADSVSIGDIAGEMLAEELAAEIDGL